MRTFNRAQIQAFLAAVDAELKHDAAIKIIGGSAASLAYHVSLTTRDIDTANSIAPIEEACAIARRKTGLDIPVGFSSVHDGPYLMDDRWVRLAEPATKHLLILVPEKHDLALMKMLRGDQHDLEAIVEMHQGEPFDLKIFSERYKNEMSHTIGKPETLRLNFLSMIGALFGDRAAMELSNQI